MGSVKFRLAQLYDQCECEKKRKHELHYIKFDETFQRLREVTDDVIKYFSNKGDVIEFVIGQFSISEREDRPFNFANRKTWSKMELKERKKFWEEKGFNEMVVIGCVEEDLIRQDVVKEMRDAEIYAITLVQRLVMHYTYNKADERLYNDSLQVERTSLTKSRANLLFVALRFQSNRYDRWRDASIGSYRSGSRSSRKWDTDTSSCYSRSSSSSSSSSSDSSSSDKSFSSSSSSDESSYLSDGSKIQKPRKFKHKKKSKEKSKHKDKGRKDKEKEKKKDKKKHKNKEKDGKEKKKNKEKKKEKDEKKNKDREKSDEESDSCED